MPNLKLLIKNVIYTSTIFVILSLNCLSLLADDEKMSDLLGWNTTTGVNFDAFTSSEVRNIAIEQGFVMYWVTNGAFHYNIGQGATLFGGVGFTNMVQLQYGFHFPTKENLIRVKTEFPMEMFFPYSAHKTFWANTYVGFYYIKSDKKIVYNGDYGFLFSINLKMLYDYLGR